MPGEIPSSAPQRSLPTLDRLQAQLAHDSDLDAGEVARNWFVAFSSSIESHDAEATEKLFLDDGFWRDTLALTWEFRTFEGGSAIRTFLRDTLPKSGLSMLRLDEASISLQQPFPDLAWIHAFFAFQTDVGQGIGVIRLVPTASLGWKAYTVYTALERLKDHPERTGTLRDHDHSHGNWPELRRKESNFEDSEPAVLIIGAGQSGLTTAARLKLLGVPTLLVERNVRIGDQWRGRYESLCLHDPVWFDHLPYIPFPSYWPVWSPAPKLGDWLECYAQSMDLNVWTGSSVTKVDRDEAQKDWIVSVTRADGSYSTVRPRHVIFANGYGGGRPNMPSYPGEDRFKGHIVHSSQFQSSKENVGKKVVVIGSGSSGHDIAMDHYQNGIDVTMHQRSSTCVMSSKTAMPVFLHGLYWGEECPPTDVADLISHSIPNNVLRLIHRRLTKSVAEADAELLANLQNVGFKLNFGDDDSGFLFKAYDRGGGFYLDVGASQLIIDGKIKFKNGSQISHYTEDGVVFEDGSSLPADVVIFATGYGDQRHLVKELCGEEIASKMLKPLGLNREGEINTIWRHSGVLNLYLVFGNLALSRYCSKQLALLIKATEEGLIKGRYVD